MSPVPSLENKENTSRSELDSPKLETSSNGCGKSKKKVMLKDYDKVIKAAKELEFLLENVEKSLPKENIDLINCI